jgi:hypothetical protein
MAQIRIADTLRHDEVIQFFGTRARVLAAGAQAAGGHKDVAVSERPVALVDQKNIGAAFRRSSSGSESGQPGPNHDYV